MQPTEILISLVLVFALFAVAAIVAVLILAVAWVLSKIKITKN